jgi:hypothetical protein
LQRLHERAADDDRIDGRMRLGGVAAMALDVDGKLVRGRHQRPGPDGKMAERQARHVVHAIDLVNPEPLHHPVLDHGAAAGAALLRRLEDEQGRAGEAARLGEIARRAQKHGRVAVVAAGMHLAGHCGEPRLAAFLGDRQRVHVGPQADDRPGSAALALEHADDTGAADPLDDLVAAEFAELRSHVGRRAMDVVKELRMAMIIAPPMSDLVVKLGEAVDDGHEGSPSPRHYSPPRPCRNRLP